VHKKDYALNQGHLMPGISAAAFPSIDRTTTRVAVLAVMGRHERVNPGAEMIAYLRKAATTLDDDADVSGPQVVPTTACEALEVSQALAGDIDTPAFRRSCCVTPAAQSINRGP